jgi:hypothetical protein
MQHRKELQAFGTAGRAGCLTDFNLHRRKCSV